MKLYQAPDDTVVIIRRMLLIAIAAMPFFYPMATVMPCVLRSAGDANFSSLISLITLWVIRVVTGYCLGIVLGYGVIGIFSCIVIEWVVKTIAYGLRYRGEVWLTKKAV